MTTTSLPIEEIDVPPGHGIMHTATSADGDQRLMWDRDNADEVDAARAMFDTLTAKGYSAFEAEGKQGNQGKRLRKFDPKAERIIMVKQLVGG
jgi:hypothetical protein